MMRRLLYLLAGLLVLGLPTTASAEEACPNAQLRLETGSTQLSDCRAYEMVSPPDKNGGGFQPSSLTVPATMAASGDAVVSGATAFFAEPQSGDTIRNAVLFRRTGEGWSAHSIDAPLNAEGQPFSANRIQVVSDDKKHLITLVKAPTLTPEAAPGTLNMYVRDNEANSYRLVTVGAPANEPFFAPVFLDATADFSQILFQANAALTPNAAGGGATNVYKWSNGHVTLIGVLPNGETPAGGSSDLGDQLPYGEVWTTGKTWMSTDGSRAFFGANGSSYIWENGVVKPLGGFVTASEDGSKVLMGKEIEDVVTGQKVSIGSGSGSIEGVVGVSDDLSYVYFVGSQDVLTDGHMPLPGCNQSLYVWHAGVIKRIADVNDRENLLWLGVNGPQHVRRVTPDGRNLIFFDHHPITSYESGEAQEIYRFNAPSGQLDCVSCNPSGAAPNVGELDEIGGSGAESVGFTDDGRRIFFQTPEGLVPRDVNGKTDVYEWDEGQLSLISSGKSASDSQAGSVTPDGSDVIFYALDHLVAQDTDGSYDLYDARVDGGFSPPPPAPVSCSGEDCRAAPTLAPVFARLTSIAFSGNGNLTPASSEAAKKPTVRKQPKKHAKKHSKRRKRHRPRKATKSLPRRATR